MTGAFLVDSAGTFMVDGSGAFLTDTPVGAEHYEVRVVDRTGTILANFGSTANVEEVTWELNEPGMVRVRVPLFHPSSASIQALTTEIQVWRDGYIIHWGVALQREVDGQSVVWSCPGLLWYLTRRYFGPISIQHLVNPRFESNLFGWFAPSGTTASHSTALRVRGPGTVRLVASDVGDHYIEQTYTTGTGVTGLFLAVAAWYRIDPAVPFEPALEQRGLYVQANNAQHGSAPLWEPITANATVGAWQRVETGIQLKEFLAGEQVTVRLYAPKGAINWGACSMTEQESVSNFPNGSDVTEMMRRIVDYAQHGLGKSDLNILTSTPASGVSETVAYQFFDLPNIFATLQTYPARELADFEVRITGTTRTFTTYAPRKGSLKAFTATVPGTSVLSMAYRQDGQQTATKTIRRAAGDGSDRELGVAISTALGGLVLEDVSDAPPEITLDGLDAYAAADLTRLAQVVAIPDIEVPADSILGLVEVGDSITMAIDWGVVQDSTVRRVVRMTLTPRTDTVRVGVN